MYQKNRRLGQTRAVITALVGVALVLIAGNVDAAGATSTQSVTLGDVASHLTGTFGKLAKLITATAYIGGIGFAVGSIMKFKAHKDNPGQTPIGQPVGLLVVAMALLFLPTLLGITGNSIFGTTAQQSTISGVSSF